MSLSRFSYRPDMGQDMLGWISWEYDRLRTLTMRRSAQHAYGFSDGTSEWDKGAASAAFAFDAVHGSEKAAKCTLTVDGARAVSLCRTKCLKQLMRIQTRYRDNCSLPLRCQFTQADTIDEFTTSCTVIKSQYMVDVLIGWFQRARDVLTSRLQGGQPGRLTSVVKFVPDDEILQRAWDWASGLVTDYKSTHEHGAGNVPMYMSFLMRCVEDRVAEARCGRAAVARGMEPEPGGEARIRSCDYSGKPHASGC